MHDAHRKAAEQHELAARAHRTAAEHNEKGDPDEGSWHSQQRLSTPNTLTTLQGKRTPSPGRS